MLFIKFRRFLVSYFYFNVLSKIKQRLYWSTIFFEIEDLRGGNLWLNTLYLTLGKIQSFT